MRVLIVVDKEGTALDRLAQLNKKYLPHIHIDVVAVHPKRPDAVQLAEFERCLSRADVIDFAYFRTAEMLFERYGSFNKPTILTHYNPYSTEGDWSKYDIVVAANREIEKKLPQSKYIPICVDTDFWTFNQEYTKRKSVIMVANRIEGKKGILPVAQVCAKLGYPLILVGSISNAEYFRELTHYPIEFAQNISDEELRNLYYQSAVHICNSVDNFESGTMPILEAMLCGVPVLTRMVGHVPDLYNEKNLEILPGQPEDLDSLEFSLRSLMQDSEKREAMRHVAWNTAKNHSGLRRAREYERLYHGLISDQPLVSAIVPTFNNIQGLHRTLNAVLDQSYQHCEILVCDDGSKPAIRKYVEKFAEISHLPVKYLRTGKASEYGLAKARNCGAIEASGKYLLFLDDRMVMNKEAITEFMTYTFKKSFNYGWKGSKKDFVENFSFVERSDFIKAGMFCERMTEYGGLSQETRLRFRAQGFVLNCVETATARPFGKSSNKWQKKEQIRRMKDRLWMMGLT